MSTFLSLHFHITFSTKHRAPLIEKAWLPRLHEYLGGTVVGLGGHADCIGGIADHVHLLIGLKATHCLADVVREVKKASSAWIHDEIGIPSFAWQEGYAAFTVSPSARPLVRKYIRNQDDHHRKKSFREELLEMLRMAGLKFDPNYIE